MLPELISELAYDSFYHGLFFVLGQFSEASLYINAGVDFVQVGMLFMLYIFCANVLNYGVGFIIRKTLPDGDVTKKRLKILAILTAICLVMPVSGYISGLAVFCAGILRMRIILVLSLTSISQIIYLFTI